MSNDPLKGIVHILNNNGETVGSGFLASPNGIIVTCSHVVLAEGLQKYNQPIPDQVKVKLFADFGDVYTATVLKDYWLNYRDGDVAILKLVEPLPESAIPFRLGVSSNKKRKRATAYGAVKVQHMDISTAPCEIGDLIPCSKGIGWLQLCDAHYIRPGFSGSAVIDEETNSVIAMVVSITNTNHHDLQGSHGLAFATTVETIIATCPILKIDVPSKTGIESLPDVCNFDLTEIVQSSVKQLSRKSGLHGLVIRTNSNTFLEYFCERLRRKFGRDRLEQRLTLSIDPFTSVDVAIKRIKQNCFTAENKLIQKDLLYVVKIMDKDATQILWQKLQTIFNSESDYRYVMILVVGPDTAIPVDVYELGRPVMNEMHISSWVDDITINCDWKFEERYRWVEGFMEDCSIEGNTELDIELIYDHLNETLKWLQADQTPQAFFKQLEGRLANV